MNTFVNKKVPTVNEQDQTNLFSTEDKLESGFYQDTDLNSDYDNSIYYDDDSFLDIYEAIEGEKTRAYLSFREIEKTQDSSLKNLLLNIENKISFHNVDAELNIVLEKDDIEESVNCEFMFNAFWHIVTQYSLQNKIDLLQIVEAKDKPMWMNRSNCFSFRIPASCDALELALYKSKPAKIVFLQTTNHENNMCNRDLVFGLGIYLFDENDNLISKMVYKFFDESIAPENALRLNIATALWQFYDSSRCFF
ncbi:MULTISPECIES: hypothetical protein [Acinetobacter]|uniref:hypothetical protein n=1 Tax=Acinetobacter TaxID=469 RepID=UPI00097F9FAF|nr:MULTISPECIES: hypothetical protein [Acinetobacter]ONN51059.1 hypothetical protein AC057_17835 [Acinetobacter genomosp. 33YU]PPC33725.1 hypothetical protein AbaMCR8676_07095 [Acinetobacter baumannii]PPC60174.1 hypothetical protein AbaMCR56_05370 [Acinetobacter baumannii]TPU44392.1 hypothetical protein FJU84_13745 [Acinetobacter baumannii]